MNKMVFCVGFNRLVSRETKVELAPFSQLRLDGIIGCGPNIAFEE